MSGKVIDDVGAIESAVPQGLQMNDCIDLVDCHGVIVRAEDFEADLSDVRSRRVAPTRRSRGETLRVGHQRTPDTGALGLLDQCWLV